MTEKTKTDNFSVNSIAREVESQCDMAGQAAKRKAYKATEVKFISKLRKLYSGKKIYVYDESHMNRFATEPLREWNAIAFSFEECKRLAEAHIRRYHDDKGWMAVEEGLTQFGAVEPQYGQFLVFQAGSYWYCFWCLTGDELCDKIAEYIAYEKKEKECRMLDRFNHDNYDNL